MCVSYSTHWNWCHHSLYIIIDPGPERLNQKAKRRLSYNFTILLLEYFVIMEINCFDVFILIMQVLRLYNWCYHAYWFQETERNTHIKDAMREQAVLQLADSWHQIMVHCWFKHILLNYKNTLLTQIYKHFKQWIKTKDDNLIKFFSRYIQVQL